MDFSIAYGHPDEQPARRLKMTLEVTLDFTRPGQLGIADKIIAESDEPYRP